MEEPTQNRPMDQETCRICRCEGTDEEPLFHPCKCSGSIKHVHQACLDEWLKHSKKHPVCELCHTPYQFTKVYSSSMPSQLPLLVFIRKFASDLTEGTVVALRCVVVTIMWILVLPFTAGLSCALFTKIAECIPHDRQPALDDQTPSWRLFGWFSEHLHDSAIPPLGFLQTMVARPVMKNVIHNVSVGQLIILGMCMVIFVVVVARDWILSNDTFVQQLRELNQPPAAVLQDGGLYNRQHRVRLEMRQPDGHNHQMVFGHDELERLVQRQALRRLEQEVRNRQLQQEQRGAERLRQQHQWGDEHDEDDEDDEDYEPHDEEEEDDDDSEEEVEEENGDQNDWEEIDDDRAELEERLEQAQGWNLPPEFQEPLRQQMDDFDPNMEDADGGVLEMIGIQGPIQNFLSSFMIANVLATCLTFALYFLPYCVGRLDLFLIFHTKLLHVVKYSLQCLFYAGNEVFYQGAKLMANVVPLDLTTLEQEAVERYATGLQFTALNLNIPGYGIWTRLGCTMLGHGMSLLLAGVYRGSNKRFSSTAQAWQYELAVLKYITQAQAILKVITVIGIELVAFPIFCGILLIQLALHPLYPEGGSFHNRILFTMNHPVISTFSHWAVGTSYMFLFATFVSLCRKIMRPGVLYFVRDPNDPNFQPIKDVLDRRLISQLHKIFISAMIYSVLIVVCIGGIVAGLRYGVQVHYLPLHLIPEWNESHFFTIAPMILSYNMLLPILNKIIRSLNIMRKIWDGVFHYSCSLLRLSSFILNRPVPQERGYVYFGSWWAKLRFAQPDYTNPVTLERARDSEPNAAYFIHDGRFVRAPNSDSISPKVKLRMFVPVTKNDERLDGQADDGEHELTQYELVYRPPLFKLRVSALLVIIWAAGIVVVFAVSALPLIIGRAIFDLAMPQYKLGDLVNYALGIVPVSCAIYVADNWSRISEQISTHLSGDGEHQMVDKLVEAAKLGGKAVISVAVMLGLVPMMLGLLLDLYVMTPATMYLGAKFELSSLGILLHGLAIMVFTKDIILSRFPDSAPARRYQDMARGGWNDYNLKAALESFVLPVIGCTITGLLAPKSVGWLATRTVYSESSAEVQQLIYVLSYPVVLCAALSFATITAILSILQRWETAVRDDAYMVGRQLQNM